MIVRGETVIHNGVLDVICSRCAKSCAVFIAGTPAGFEFASLHAKWGFHSKRDLEEHEAQICQTCYEELLPEFERLGIEIEITQYSPLA